MPKIKICGFLGVLGQPVLNDIGQVPELHVIVIPGSHAVEEQLGIIDEHHVLQVWSFLVLLRLLIGSVSVMLR